MSGHGCLLLNSTHRWSARPSPPCFVLYLWLLVGQGERRWWPKGRPEALPTLLCPLCATVGRHPERGVELGGTAQLACGLFLGLKKVFPIEMITIICISESVTLRQHNLWRKSSAEWLQSCRSPFYLILRALTSLIITDIRQKKSLRKKFVTEKPKWICPMANIDSRVCLAGRWLRIL